MTGWTTSLLKRVFAAFAFITMLLLLILITAASGYGAALLASKAGIPIGLTLTAIFAFISTHLVFGSHSLEMHLLTALSIFLAWMLSRHSPWGVAIPGAVAGFFASLAIGEAISSKLERQKKRNTEDSKPPLRHPKAK